MNLLNSKRSKICSIIKRVTRSLTQNVTNDKKIILTLYTKPMCSLCDNAKEFIEENYPNKFFIEEIDITKDRVLFRKFKLDIPVFYHKNTFLMQHKADKNILDKLIKT